MINQLFPVMPIPLGSRKTHLPTTSYVKVVTVYLPKPANG